MSNNKMTVAYVRLSDEDLEKKGEYSVSIYNQLSLIKDYANRMELSIDREYVDDGYSGINFDRPGFEKMVNDIETEKISTVITKDMSRLGREFIDTAYYISEYFPKYNIRYIAINDQYDSNSPDNITKEIMVNIRAIVNDRYVKDTSLKRAKTAIAKTENGEFIGFLAPYGYKIVKKGDKRTLEIDEYAAGIVKRIFTNIASGKTRNEVAEDLNKDKVLPPVIYMNMTPSKNKSYYYDWSSAIIYRILKNKTYIGATVIRKSLKRNYKQKKRIVIPIQDREIKEDTHPAIITMKLYEEANSRLKTMKRKEKNNYDGTFSNLVVCGECGRVMTACRKRRENGNVEYYFACTKVVKRKKCPNKIIHDNKLRTIIENTLKELIDDFVDKEEIISDVTRKMVQKDRTSMKITNIKKDIEVHDTNIKNLYLKKTKGEITLDEFIKEKNRESELKNKQEENLRMLVERENSDYKKSEVLHFYNQFINGDIFLKDYIKDIIEKIIIHKDNTIQIVFKFGVGKTKTIKLY